MTDWTLSAAARGRLARFMSDLDAIDDWVNKAPADPTGADDARVCVLSHASCTETTCEFYRGYCPHVARDDLAESMHAATVRVYPEV